MDPKSPLSLDQIAWFASLPADARAELAAIQQLMTLRAGAILFREGERGDTLYLLLDGQVEIIKSLDTPDQRLIRVQGPGALLGEMALLDPDGLRTASVRALTDIRLATLAQANFDALLVRRPSLALELVRTLALRLRDADNATIRDLHEKNRQLEEAYRQLQAAHEQIVEKEKLERELQLAREMQENILPREMPLLPGYDFAALMVPARAVGGDFFDFIPLHGGDLGIVVADVSDKGMPAAIFMGLTRSLVRAEASRGVFPAEVLRRVNEHLVDMNASGSFVTVLYGILHARTGEFLYARAGHELPLLVEAGGQLIPLPHGRGQVLGVLPAPALDEQTIRIPPGGRLLLYTDGVTDATDLRDQPFGLELLQAAVNQSQATSAQALVDELWQVVAAHQGAAPQFDDFTMVVVQSHR